MRKWKEYKINDIARVVGGGTPRTSNPDYWNGDIPWITPRDLTGYSKMYIDGGERSITSKGLNKSSTQLLPKGTVLLTSRAPIGYVAIAKNNICTNQGFKSLILNEDLAYNQFIYYWIKNNVDYLQSIGTGTTFAEISGSVVKEIEILLPPLPEQKAIASVLSSLDDKIDLLHQQNQTLEALAETLFRQWFVEEAKEDWEERPLLHYFDLLGGFAFKSKEYLDEGKYRVITIKGVQDGFLETSNAARLNELPHKIKPHQILKEGDILISLTGNVGRVCLVDEKNCLLNQRVAKIVPHKESWKPFAYFYFRQREMIKRLTHLAKGSAQLNLSPIETLNEIEAFGGDDHIDEFCQHVNSIFKRILKNKKQIRTLTQLRDTLLPKLMSGEVRVKM